MKVNAKLLRESFEALRPQGDELVKTFYAILFERHPGVKPMFAKTNMEEQRKKFFDTLDVIVQNLEKPDALLSHLLLLGNSHVDYGARPEHYPAVLESIVEAMKRTAGPRWSDELGKSWSAAYTVVAEIMMRGSALRRPSKS